MIARYSRPEMALIWSDQSRLLQWLELELVVCEELAKSGELPKKDVSRLRKKASLWVKKEGGPSPLAVAEREKVTRHDVLAFTEVVAQHLGTEAKWIHYGLTSTDVVDTAQALQILAAGDLIRQSLVRLEKVFMMRAQEFQALPTIGRTHGVWAEPTSFGLKFLAAAQECRRNKARLNQALEELRVGKLSGAVGVNAHFSPEMEARILKRVGLKREWVSTQVLPRDRHAELFSVFALIGGMLERVSVEFRGLARSEVAEVREGFAKGQKGSSAMPHKRNPIGFENMTGCARLLRSYAQAAFENQALWHERDISHSSVERVILPDAFLLLDYSLDRMAKLIENLEVDSEGVHRNLQSAGEKSFSGHLLLGLVRSGVAREEAYRWVQEVAFADSSEGSFADRASRHVRISQVLNAKEIKKLCSLSHQLRHVKEIFREAKREMQR